MGLECMRKQCFFLERFEDKSFWKRREKEKQERKKIKEKQQKADLILARFRDLTSELEDFAVCAVELKNGIYCVRCVTIEKVDLSYFSKSLEQEFGVRIKLSFIQNTRQARRNLISILKEREKTENSL